MCDRFVHIHNHTEYSLLDGANRISAMVARAKELEMEALAISDHGVMFGVVEFYNECTKAGVKPILGVEAYVSPNGIQSKKGDGEKSAYHLLLLAKNIEGYRNLCRLSSIAALEGYYYKPRVDHEILRKYSAGVIATSACLGSEVCQELLKGDYNRAQYMAGMYAEMFGEGNFFIELQDHGLPEQRRINPDLVKIARELNLPLVATNDAHYRCKGDSEPHDVLLCIQTGSNVADTNRMKFQTEEFYLKDQKEMSALFRDYPEALENTARIAEMCNVQIVKEDAAMPQAATPEGVTSLEHLRELAYKGLKDRAKNPELSLDRLEYELDVITKTGFGDYFLLVREFANVARDKGIYYGVRGSAAGSLVSYCIGITDVDPVEYGLTFERFLNPERISMPDIDMDFEDARRDEVIQYVNDRFGKDHVAQIITFGTLGAKAAIKDCGRVMGYLPQETDRITKLIPGIPNTTLDKAYKEVTEFRELVDGDPRIRQLFDTAKSVEGMARNSGVHAAGVVISREPLMEYLPLYRGNDGQPVTAFAMGILEKIGMLKMDFLGLSNLTVLARCVENIKRRTGETLNIQSIEDGDAKTYEMLARGETTGVFQLEGGGMTRWVMQLKPASIRELAAMVALYRPGPMEHIPRFIDVKFGRQKAEYLDDRMRPILEETYGVIVYQDQVMQLVQALAGFSLGKADVLRRAMGKKDAKALASMKTEFKQGTEANGISDESAETVWALLEPFAGYAFNKAHAVCYAILAYQTAYLKANYPVEYMAALLSVYLDKEDKVTAFIEECRRMKIAVLPPDVNESIGDFSVESYKHEKSKRTVDAIRFGLVAIKGVGEGVVEGIVAERLESGPYEHLYEFADRTKALGMNRIALEALVKAGALDSIDQNRRKLLEHVDGALQYADLQQRRRLGGQTSLFGGGVEEPESMPTLPTDIAAYTRTELLALEKEVMGIYVSDHPLRGMERALQENSSATCSAALDLPDGTAVKLAGVVSKYRVITTKNEGKKMLSFSLEDFSGQIGCTVFPASFERLKDIIVKDATIVLHGFTTHREMRGEKSIEIRVDKAEPLPEVENLPSRDDSVAGTVRISMRKATESTLKSLRKLVEDSPGSYQCVIQVINDDRHLPIYLVQQVDPSSIFIDAVRGQFGASAIEVQHSDLLSLN